MILHWISRFAWIYQGIRGRQLILLLADRILFKVAICIIQVKLEQQMDQKMDKELCWEFLHWCQCGLMSPLVIISQHRTLINVPIDRSQYSLFGTNDRSQCSLSGTNSLKLCNLNTRSVKSKSADFLCYVQSCAADIFAITETWFTWSDSAHRAEVTPPGYKLYDHARTGRSGGGTALLCRDNIKVTKIAAGERKSFEFSEWIILGQGSQKVRIVVLYRLQYSSTHPVTISVFFDEFSKYLESIILSSEPLLITGDFNIHVDVIGHPDREKFLDLLEAMGLQQHVTMPTHELGHTLLDLIITRQCEIFVKDLLGDYHISDHWSVTCLLNLDKPSIIRKLTATFRKIKNIDFAVLSNFNLGFVHSYSGHAQ